MLTKTVLLRLDKLDEVLESKAGQPKLFVAEQFVPLKDNQGTQNQDQRVCQENQPADQDGAPSAAQSRNTRKPSSQE